MSGILNNSKGYLIILGSTYLVFSLWLPIPAFASVESFLVERVGDEQVVVNDGISQYIIESNYECYSSDFYEGQTIFIDTYGYPSYGDTIILNDYLDTTCEISDAEEVDLERFYVSKVLDSDEQVIVEDKRGNRLLAEYGIGCLSMWRYEGRYIDIDIGGAFLDGIGDTIYLLDSDDDCRVWDAEEINSNSSTDLGSSSGGSSQQDLENLLQAVCPANSTYSNDSCVCDDGYVAIGESCVTYSRACQLQYGVHSYGDSEHCYCSSGYIFNDSETSCVAVPAPPPNQQTTDSTPKDESIAAEELAEYVEESEIRLLPQPAKGVLTVAGSFRSCPSTDCNVVRYYAEGATLSVLGTNQDSKWLRVEGKDDNGELLSGWMHTSLFEEGFMEQLSTAGDTMEEVKEIEEEPEEVEKAVSKEKDQEKGWLAKIFTAIASLFK